jgi:hypothetical protein
LLSVTGFKQDQQAWVCDFLFLKNGGRKEPETSEFERASGREERSKTFVTLGPVFGRKTADIECTTYRFWSRSDEREVLAIEGLYISFRMRTDVTISFDPRYYLSTAASERSARHECALCEFRDGERERERHAHDSTDFTRQLRRRAASSWQDSM